MAVAELQPKRRRDYNNLIDRVLVAKTYGLTSRDSCRPAKTLKEWSWYLSTPEIPDIQIGTAINRPIKIYQLEKGFNLHADHCVTKR